MGTRFELNLKKGSGLTDSYLVRIASASLRLNTLAAVISCMPFKYAPNSGEILPTPGAISTTALAPGQRLMPTTRTALDGPTSRLRAGVGRKASAIATLPPLPFSTPPGLSLVSSMSPIRASSHGVPDDSHVLELPLVDELGHICRHVLVRSVRAVWTIAVVP